MVTRPRFTSEQVDELFRLAERLDAAARDHAFAIARIRADEPADKAEYSAAWQAIRDYVLGRAESPDS